MTLHIVGLGPGDAALLTQETARLLASGLPLVLRTRHHPAVAAGMAGRPFVSCDDLYQAGGDFEETYEAIAERVLEHAGEGDTVFAVPGNPLVSERAVVTLVREARRRGVECMVYPALSYVDVAATALGMDLGDTQLCDALALRIDPSRPALISQVYDRDTATSLKLELLDLYPPSHGVFVLSDLGTAGAHVAETTVSELDHRAFGHLDCLYLPPVRDVEDLRRLEGVWALIHRLHAPGGCPWDREQTHASLRHHLLEESYECLEAIDSGDRQRLAEELGDVLLQVLMHAAVAEREEESFALGDVAEGLARKLIRRHPHVFGDAAVGSAHEAWLNWDALKRAEKPEHSALAGVPPTLPALAASQAIQGRARRVGFDWPDLEGPLDKLGEEIREFAAAGDATEREDEFGDILFVVANIADRLGIDAEEALRGANTRFRRRFSEVERLATERGLALADLDLPALDALWDEAKALEPRA